jgi:hypothetical protein
MSFNPFLIHLLGNLEGGIPDLMAEKYQTTSDSVDSFGFILEGIIKELGARGITPIQKGLFPTLCQEETKRCDAREGKAEGEEAALKHGEKKVLFPCIEAGFFCQEFATWHDQSKGETEVVSHGDSVRAEDLMAPANAIQNKKDIHELKTPQFVDVSDDFGKIAEKTEPYTQFKPEEWVLPPAHDDYQDKDSFFGQKNVRSDEMPSQNVVEDTSRGQDLKHMKSPGDQGVFPKDFDVKRGNADTPGFQVNGKVSSDSEYAGGLRNFPEVFGNSSNEQIYEEGSRASFMALASSIADTAGAEGDSQRVIYRSNFYDDRGAILKESLGAAINLMRREGAQKAVVEVHPPELGRIEINVDITQSGELRAAFRVAGSDTANLLTGQLDSLRQTLTATGFQVLGLDVFLNHDGDRDARHGWEKNFKRQKVSHDGLLGSVNEGEKMSFLLNMDAGLLQWIA